MLTVDQLKKMGGYPHYSGLGVIKCRIGSDRSYHFYCDKTPCIIDQIHDHRFGFRSTLVAGRLRNIIYEVVGQDSNSVYQLEEGECKPGAERKILLRNADVVEVDRFVTEPGNSYYIKHDTLHRIEHLDPVTITYLEKDPFAKMEAHFVINTTRPRICAASLPESHGDADHTIVRVTHDAETIGMEREMVAERMSPDKCWEIIEYALGLVEEGNQPSS